MRWRFGPAMALLWVLGGCFGGEDAGAGGDGAGGDGASAPDGAVEADMGAPAIECPLWVGLSPWTCADSAADAEALAAACEGVSADAVSICAADADTCLAGLCAECTTYGFAGCADTPARAAAVQARCGLAAPPTVCGPGELCYWGGCVETTAGEHAACFAEPSQPPDDSWMLSEGLEPAPRICTLPAGEGTVDVVIGSDAQGVAEVYVDGADLNPDGRWGIGCEDGQPVYPILQGFASVDLECPLSIESNADLVRAFAVSHPALEEDGPLGAGMVGHFAHGGARYRVGVYRARQLLARWPEGDGLLPGRYVTLRITRVDPPAAAGE